MQHGIPKRLSLLDLTYKLPDEKIARFPLIQRDETKLLVYEEGEIKEDFYYNLTEHLPSDTFMIFNNTKVVEARLLFQKSTGGEIEIFCLEPGDIYHDITVAMQQREKVEWKCLVGGSKKWKGDSVLSRNISLAEGELLLEARKLEKSNDYFLIEFQWNQPDMSFSEVLHLAGNIPIPPYLNRRSQETDKERYQTIYAKLDGSVAAPTAGLHFTDRVFKKMNDKNIEKDFVTLHVGAGTFKPVTASTIEEHEMHREYIEVRANFIEKLIRQLPKKIVCVGTTSVRTVESLYWLGVKTCEDENIRPEDLNLNQWELYDLRSDLPVETALNGLIQWLQRNRFSVLYSHTRMIITPGYPIKIVDGIITNFHQPKSTLLLLVAAFIYDDWKKVYDYALEHDFRFLSYGDGSLLWKRTV